jgi:hypothetical protein
MIGGVTMNEKLQIAAAVFVAVLILWGEKIVDTLVKIIW